jgi:transcription elongation factor SPT6
MSNSFRDLIDGDVEVDDEENDESFDEETGEVRTRNSAQNGHIDDSSEEEEDDDDEEAALAVCLTFLGVMLLAPIAESVLGPSRFYHR